MRDSGDSRSIFEAHESAMSLIHADGTIVAVNAGFCVFVLLQEQQIVGRAMAEFVHPEDLARVLGLHRQVLKSPPPAECRYESRFQRKDGGVLDCLVTATTVPGTGQLVCSYVDITAHKALESSYRMLFNAMREGFALCELLLDAQGRPRDLRILDANPAFETATGLNPADLIGKTVFELFPTLDRSWLEILGQVALGGEAAHFENYAEPVGRHLELTAFRAAPLRIACIFTDITWRRQIEGDRGRLLAAIEAVAESIVITDIKGVIRYVNPAYERVTGYTRAEAIGRNPRMLKSGRQDAATYAELWGAISSGRDWKGHLVNRRKDGSLFTEDAIISPVRDDSGKLVSYMAVKRDITDELRLREELLRSRNLESVGRLAGGVAHDFNNMLSVILLSAEAALLEPDPDERFRPRLAEISKAAEHSAGLTRQLLAFGRRQASAPVPLDLNATLRQSLGMLRVLLGEDIRVVCDLQADLWEIMADAVQMDQVLTNLCVNGRDAIAGTGTVTITTRNLEAGQGEGGAGTDRVLLSVADTGCGMDAETQARIFEPFFTTKGAGRGTGLGLSTVYGIVQQNHGSIEVHSVPGGGSTFRVLLPRRAEPAAAAAEPVGLGAPVPGRQTVLVVDDEVNVLAAAAAALKRSGYRVLEANSADEALELSDAFRGEIHLLLTDVIMPGMNGRRLAEALVTRRPGLRVLLMSGYAPDSILEHGVPLQGVQLLAKPFNIRTLDAKVLEALEGGPTLLNPDGA